MHLLEKSWVIFLSAMILGVFLPNFAQYLEPYLTIILITMMTVALKDINIRDIFHKNIKKPLLLFATSYFILTPIIILLSFLIKDIDFRTGFIVMASVPCAIAVIPFSKLLNGDIKSSTSGLLITYFASLFMTPLIIWIFFKQAIETSELLKTIFLLVILPLILSRFIKKLNHRIEKYDKSIINFLLFIGIYGFIGLNSHNITNLYALRFVLIALFLRTFLLTIIVYFISRKWGSFGISLTIFSGYKNLGYAALLALTLFGVKASLPATIAIIFEVGTFIFLELINRVPENRSKLAHIS